MSFALPNECRVGKVYTNSPVWQLDKEIASIDLSLPINDNVAIVDSKFGQSLAIQEEDGLRYLPFKRGVTATATGKYTIGRFLAVRDSQEFRIAKGDVSFRLF